MTKFLLLCSLFANLILFQKLTINSQKQEGILVLEVLDGDTILLEHDVRLRLRHVDAPELNYCGGQEAKDMLTKITKNKKIVIKEQIIDNYGRPMALVYVGNTLINLEMLKSGWVRYHSDDTSQTEVLKAIASKTKESKIGIWSSKCYQTINPDNPKCNIKGNTDKNSSTKNYYYPGCAQYEFTIIEKDLGEQWFCTQIEAQKAGFTRAATCH
jgi:micrococcal nuclease